MGSTEKQIQALSIIGLLSGLVAVASIIIVGDTYGTPGSVAYQIYESFNRVMAVLIFLESCVIAAFYMQRHQLMGKLEKTLVRITFIAWLGMAVGTAAEFWLFSNLPYAAANMRSVSFSVFSFSSLIAGLTLFLLGLRILFGRQLPLYFGVILILYLPADVLLFVTGQSIFLASALITIAIASFTLVWDGRIQKQTTGGSLTTR